MGCRNSCWQPYRKSSWLGLVAYNFRMSAFGRKQTFDIYAGYERCVRENAPPEPDRSATRVVLLPLLPSGPDGVHRGSPCGARPGRHFGSTWVETGGERGIRTLGTPFRVHTLSRRAPSTTRTSLQFSMRGIPQGRRILGT